MYLPFQSVSQWETSYFGGYYKVLEDHPEVSVSESIKIKPTENGDQYLFDDMKEKLLKLFIHTISVDKKLVQDLRTSTYSEPFESDGKYWVVMSKKSVNELLNKIINKRKEISLLFQYYKKTITESDILFEVPPPKSKSDSKEGKDDSKKKGKSDKSKMKSDMSKPSEGTSKPNDNERSIGNFTIPKPDLSESFEKEISKTELLKFIDDNTENISGHLKNKTEFVYMNKKNRNCIFSPSQVKFSNSLLSLLDISFDSKEAKLDNLMCGKMSSHKIAEVQAGNSRVYHKIEEDMETRPFTICVLGDESGSMECEYDKSQNELFRILYRTFSQILPQDKMFFYGHSGYATPEIRVYHEPNYPFFENTIDEQLKNSYYENYDGPVIEKIYERVRSITDDNIIFIVISDGYPAGKNYGSRKDRENMKCVIEKCSRDGFVTMGVGLCHGGVEDLYKYHTVVDEMEDLVRNVSQLVNNVVKMEFQS